MEAEAEPETLLISRSPSPGKRKAEEVDQVVPSDLQLVPGGASQEAPQWALALQSNFSVLNQNLSQKLDRVLVQNEEMTDRVRHLEAKSDDDRVRLSKLEGELSALKQAIETGSRATSAPPSEPVSPPAWPRPPVMIPPPASLRDETDFSHLILGGWKLDTKRQIIEGDIQRFIQTFQPDGVTKTAVYGKRDRIGHVWLQPLPDQQARSRFYELLPRANKRMHATGGDPIWISPSKPLAVRERNKLLRQGLDRVLRVMKLDHADPAVELDWSKGLLWLKDVRVMALWDRALLAQDQKTISIRFSHGLSAPGSCFYNLEALSRIGNRNPQELEAEMRSE